MTQLRVMPGMAYAVVWRDLDQVAWCRALDNVVELMREHRLARRVEVIRVDGDVCVWPMVTKGGEA